LCARGAAGASGRSLDFTVRRMADVDLSTRPSRMSEIMLGVVATLLGAALALFAALVVWRAFVQQLPTSVVIIFSIAFGLGLILFVAGLRLLTGKRRSAGGLFSPWVLRFGGLIFFAGPIAVLFTKPALLTILKAAAGFGAGVACFALANRREQRIFERGSEAPNNRWRDT
jgi:hypothetical protein